MDKKKKLLRMIKGIVLSVFAGFLNALSVHTFVNPNTLIPGGFTGIASLLYYVFPQMEISVTYILLNVPLLIASVIYIKSEFTINTIVATVACTSFLAFLPEWLVFTSAPLISVLCGGVLIGSAMYVAHAVNGSNAGTEIVARLVARKKPEMDISTLILIFNMSILLIGSFVMVAFKGESLWVVFDSIIFILMGGEFMGILLRGFNRAQKFMIITSKYNEIAEEIVAKTKRGLNTLDLYDEEGNVRDDAKAIMVLCQYRQCNLIKSIIRKHDDDAFTFVKEINHVFSRPSFHSRSYKHDENN